ncbi:MAG TPA: ABC transporter permease [Firmicutes bacterium]|nr:ABC transporter permease [Bacillota bacterium]
MGILTAIALFLQSSMQMGTTILYGTLGGILGERAGNLNLGVEGMMLMGAVMGFMAGVKTGSAFLAVLIAGLAGAFGALIYAIVTVTFRGNQTVTGLALTIFGTGFSSFVGKSLSGVALPSSVTQAFAAVKVPFLSDIPLLGPMLFHQSAYVIAALILAVLMYLYFQKTKVGLNHKAVGENPSAADASGINTTLYKYLALVSGGFLCGVGGGYLTLVFVPRWQEEITAGLGWIAVALVIFCTWHPLKAILGAYFFGMLRALVFKIQGVSIPLFGHHITIASNLLDMLPYLMTVVVLVIVTLGNNRKHRPPAGLSNPFFREER